MPRTRPTVDPRRAVAYIRASKEEAKLGPEAQRAQLEAFAVRESITIVAWHHDQGVSGGAEMEDRPALVAALIEMRAAGAGLFLVAKRDRLARDRAIAALIERDVHKAGARVQSADGVGNGDDLSDNLLRGMLDLFAEHERGVIRMRTRAALAAKKARGETLGAAPYGFRYQEGSLVQSDAEQGVLAVVRELRAAGMSLRQIGAELGKRGLVSRVGRPFAPMQIGRMLAA